MTKHSISTKTAAIAVVGLVALVFMSLASRVASAPIPTGSDSQPLAASAADSQQYPVLDMIANQVVQTYTQATCAQLWLKSAEKNAPKSTQQQAAINILRADPDKRAAFISRVAAPIANRMFECGMIP